MVLSYNNYVIYIVALQVQQSWSYANDVNFLAAGASVPENGTTGTGIFAGKQGSLISVMNGEAERKLYVAKVLKKLHNTKNQTYQNDIEKVKSSPPRQTKIHLKRASHIEDFKSHLLDFALNEEFTKELCEGNFCCNFQIKSKLLTTDKNYSNYKYRIGVFNGVRNYELLEKSALQVCGLYACTNTTVASCGLIYSDNFEVKAERIFEKILITGKFEKSKTLLLMPNSLDETLYPLPVHSFWWNNTDVGWVQGF